MIRRYPFPFPQKLVEDPDYKYEWIHRGDEAEAIQEGWELLTEDMHPEVFAELKNDIKWTKGNGIVRNFRNDSIYQMLHQIKIYASLMATKEFKELIEAEDRLIVTPEYQNYASNNLSWTKKNIDYKSIIENKEKDINSYHWISPWTGGISRDYMMHIEDLEKKIKEENDE